MFRVPRLGYSLAVVGVAVERGLPFESRCHLRVPPGAMHSFHADHNEVNWKLVVKGSVIGWPDYEREFQIVVNPAPAAPI